MFPTSTASTRQFVRCAISIMAVAMVLTLDATAWACPTCREGLADNPAGHSLARGFYYSILFMMSMPFLILGTLGTVAYRSVQKAKIEHDLSN